MGVRYMNRRERAAFNEQNPPDYDVCDLIGPAGYGCSREAGHSGHKHIARDSSGNVREYWYDEGKGPK